MWKARLSQCFCMLAEYYVRSHSIPDKTLHSLCFEKGDGGKFVSWLLSQVLVHSLDPLSRIPMLLLQEFPGSFSDQWDDFAAYLLQEQARSIYRPLLVCTESTLYQ